MTVPIEAALPFEVVEQRFQDVRSRIAGCGVDPASIKIVAVTKGFGAWAIQAAIRLGCEFVGESYAQELKTKYEKLSKVERNSCKVHFIGGLQTNKIKLVSKHVNVWQSVDRVSLIDEIAKRSPNAKIMLQLDLAGESTQGGCGLDNAPALLEHAIGAGLATVGCMAIAPRGSPSVIEKSFVELCTFADTHGLVERSIGMSGDLEIAVKSGSTMVRVGTALFGAR